MKRAAARAAREHVVHGMRLGLGTGSTAAHFVDLLGARVREGLEVVGVPTSERTRLQAEGLEIKLSTLDETPELDLTIDGAGLTAAAYEAWAALMDGEQEQSPDAAVMNATTWGRIAGIVDGDKRPIFPALAPSNASGTSTLNGPGPFFGLPVVISKAIDDDTIYLPIRDGLEFYASPSGDQPFTLSVDEPGILGVETAIYGYVATYAKPDSVKALTLPAVAP
jgi:hypothetical protein